MSVRNGSTSKTQSVVVVECPSWAGWVRRGEIMVLPAILERTRQVQLLRDGGSPNLGRTAGSKRVIAETWVPDRVRTISPTV